MTGFEVLVTGEDKDETGKKQGIGLEIIVDLHSIDQVDAKKRYGEQEEYPEMPEPVLLV